MRLLHADQSGTENNTSAARPDENRGTAVGVALSTEPLLRRPYSPGTCLSARTMARLPIAMSRRTGAAHRRSQHRNSGPRELPADTLGIARGPDHGAQAGAWP